MMRDRTRTQDITDRDFKLTNQVDTLRDVDSVRYQVKAFAYQLVAFIMRSADLCANVCIVWAQFNSHSRSQQKPDGNRTRDFIGQFEINVCDQIV